ncbi:hypothetical protein DFA_04882 [Cavenderia fasciculata]|uniref:Uncharacterized protein n=1 Tax=Cavenderia fasciculata TaxID=261658 RepID=F4PM49_CACFS|nr:uncharacterized protein DFA_04882 [Cavenderia fasciculata]EGG22752.1 hypothetical protein DFA_04882 [Cavenderia fasciculata]|eukprot:XP_004360603.1 hypothetical protein DFA_04882 [Cavenderia fasciculata]
MSEMTSTTINRDKEEQEQQSQIIIQSSSSSSLLLQQLPNIIQLNIIKEITKQCNLIIRSCNNSNNNNNQDDQIKMMMMIWLRYALVNKYWFSHVVKRLRTVLYIDHPFYSINNQMQHDLSLTLEHNQNYHCFDLGQSGHAVETLHLNNLDVADSLIASGFYSSCYSKQNWQAIKATRAPIHNLFPNLTKVKIELENNQESLRELALFIGTDKKIQIHLTLLGFPILSANELLQDLDGKEKKDNQDSSSSSIIDKLIIVENILNEYQVFIKDTRVRKLVIMTTEQQQPEQSQQFLENVFRINGTFTQSFQYLQSIRIHSDTLGANCLLVILNSLPLLESIFIPLDIVRDSDNSLVIFKQLVQFFSTQTKITSIGMHSKSVFKESGCYLLQFIIENKAVRKFIFKGDDLVSVPNHTPNFNKRALKSIISNGGITTLTIDKSFNDKMFEFFASPGVTNDSIRYLTITNINTTGSSVNGYTILALLKTFTNLYTLTITGSSMGTTTKSSTGYTNRNNLVQTTDYMVTNLDSLQRLIVKVEEEEEGDGKVNLFNSLRYLFINTNLPTRFNYEIQHTIYKDTFIYIGTNI